VLQANTQNQQYLAVTNSINTAGSDTAITVYKEWYQVVKHNYIY